MWRVFLLFLFIGNVLGQTIDEIVIPRKTEIFVRLQRSISTRTANAGDKFHAQVQVPVTMNDQIVIPVGSYIIGHVEMAKRAGRVKGQGEIGLKFDTIILPNGITRQIVADLASTEGYETNTPQEGKVTAPGNQGEEAAKGAAGGAVTGAGVGAIGGRSWKGAGIGSAVGAAGGAIIGLLKRNSEVYLPTGSSLTIQLRDDVRFVKPEPVRSPQRLSSSESL